MTAAVTTGRTEVGAPLLEVRELKKYFPIRAGLLGRIRNYVKAVDGVSFDVRAGETLGLVGESGCGKTTVGRSVLRLIEPTAGTVKFRGQDIRPLRGKALRSLRREIQIIFQDPYSSLNPRMTVEQIVGEALTVHGLASGADRRQRVGELLERCGLPARAMGRYPHEFSGGQRQRVGIARALALQPDFIVCDEAVSALDVSIQAQVINLLLDIQAEMGIAYLFIAHDLSVVEHISDRVAVMYLGRIMELASSDELYRNPLHPYTRALLSAVPMPDPDRQQERIILQGDVPTPIDPPPGCPFHTRCWLAEARCSAEPPEYRDLGGDHWVACHLVDASTRTLRKDGQVVARSTAPAAGEPVALAAAPAQELDDEAAVEPFEPAEELLQSDEVDAPAASPEGPAGACAALLDGLEDDEDATLGPVGPDDEDATLGPEGPDDDEDATLGPDDDATLGPDDDATLGLDDAGERP